MDRAVGEYIWFVDSDDYIVDLSAAEKLYYAAKNDNLSMITFDTECIFESDELRHKYGEICRQGKENYKEICSGKDMFTRQMLYGGFVSTVPLYFINRIWLKQSGICFERIVHEDMLFTIVAMFFAERVSYIPEAYYGYFRRNGSITTSQKKAAEKVSSISYILTELLHRIQPDVLENDTMDALVIYFRVLKTMLVEQILVCIKKGIDIAFLRKTDSLTSKMVMEERYPFISRKITNELYTRIEDAERVIVYGAGFISKIVQLFLKDMQINNYYVAVTSGKRADVYELHELKREGALVLIAVMLDKQKDMIENLISLGFKEYELMT